MISHPRFYWGETGNVNTPALFQLPIPASRGAVQTGYDFVLPDQNGWSRSLHFQAAWVAVFTGVAFVVGGLLTGHFRKNLVPTRSDLSWPSFSKVLASHLRFKPPTSAEASYNTLQRLAYLSVVFVLAPMMIWTGLAMSPAFTAAYPATVTLLGGQQSARTLHFFVAVALLMFVAVHVVMVIQAGFRSRTMAMITGNASAGKGES